MHKARVRDNGFADPTHETAPVVSKRRSFLGLTFRSNRLVSNQGCSPPIMRPQRLGRDPTLQCYPGFVNGNCHLSRQASRVVLDTQSYVGSLSDLRPSLGDCDGSCFPAREPISTAFRNVHRCPPFFTRQRLILFDQTRNLGRGLGGDVMPEQRLCRLSNDSPSCSQFRCRQG